MFETNNVPRYTVQLVMTRDLAIELLIKEDYKVEDLRGLNLEELIKVGCKAEAWSLPE
jgi:hypothetical protein